MVRNTVLSAVATAVLLAAALGHLTSPAFAGSRTAAVSKSANVVAGQNKRFKSGYRPSPAPMPAPLPYPGDPVPPTGPIDPPEKPDWCQLGTTKCPMMPVPYPN